MLYIHFRMLIFISLLTTTEGNAAGLSQSNKSSTSYSIYHQLSTSEIPYKSVYPLKTEPGTNRLADAYIIYNLNLGNGSNFHIFLYFIYFFLSSIYLSSQDSFVKKRLQKKIPSEVRSTRYDI